MNRTPNVHRTYVRQLRAMLHAWEKFGLDAAADEFHRRFDYKHRNPKRTPVQFEHVVEGKLGFRSMVRGNADPLVIALSDRFDKLVGRSPRARPSLHDNIRAAMWILEHVTDGPGGAEVIQGTASSFEGSASLLARTPLPRIQKHSAGTLRTFENQPRCCFGPTRWT